MYKIYNKETGKTTWKTDQWFHKFALIFGWISLIYLIGAFSLGFCIAIFSYL